MNHRCVKGKSPKCVPFVSFDENKGFKPIKKSVLRLLTGTFMHQRSLSASISSYVHREFSNFINLLGKYV